jgi:putative SOS response-associated peptidase YedK
MPVILNPEAHARWLRSDAGPEELKELLVPLPGSEMKSFPVSSRVNRPQVDDATLVEPIDIVRK